MLFETIGGILAMFRQITLRYKNILAYPDGVGCNVWKPVMLVSDPESKSSAKSDDSGDKKETSEDSIMKNKLNSLLSAVDDEDDDDTELLEVLSKPKKKKFFGLF